MKDLLCPSPKFQWLCLRTLITIAASLKSPKLATLHLNTQKSMRWIPTFFQVASFFSLLTFFIVLRACSCAIASSSLLDETPSLLHQLYFISTHNFSLCLFPLFSFRLPSSLSIRLCLINYHWQWLVPAMPYSSAFDVPAPLTHPPCRLKSSLISASIYM